MLYLLGLHNESYNNHYFSYVMIMIIQLGDFRRKIVFSLFHTQEEDI